MNLSEHPLLASHSGKPAILDANLLILDWCMKFDTSLVRTFKRLNSFEVGDFQLLSETLKVFRSFWTTPHVLTEVSNLTNSLPYWTKESWYKFFARQINLIPEIYSPASEIASDSVAIRFGITDAALARLSATHVVLTIEWPLTNLLESRKLPVINFNHLRKAVRF